MVKYYIPFESLIPFSMESGVQYWTLSQGLNGIRDIKRDDRFFLLCQLVFRTERLVIFYFESDTSNWAFRVQKSSAWVLLQTNCRCSSAFGQHPWVSFEIYQSISLQRNRNSSLTRLSFVQVCSLSFLQRWPRVYSKRCVDTTSKDAHRIHSCCTGRPQ